MNQEKLLAKLREYTLFMTTITSATELMNCYALRQDDHNTKLIAKFLHEFTFGNARDIDQFDEYVRQEALNLMIDEEVAPLLIAYVKAKVQFYSVVEKLRDDEVLDAELIGSLTELS